ncbi:MAG: D-glycerate dehydrogenase [Pseudomonadota bacterium]
MKTLLITRPLPEPVIAAAREVAEVTVRDTNVPMTEDEVRAAMVGYDMMLPTLGDACTASALAPGGRCKLLANFGVGYNHIDVAAAAAAGVLVSNTPGAVTDATADIAVMLMLMTCRRAAEGERLVRAGAWEGWHPTQMLGLHMSGKTVGIVGMGRIGQAIARRCHFGFAMKVIYFNRSPKPLNDMPATQMQTLSGCMAGADVVVLAIPGGPATRHLIDAEALAAMQPHAHLVNIARGDVLDEAALIAALEERRFAGAGLDVYEFEPAVPEGLRALDNVVLLPHLGTAALEVRTSMGLMAVENIRAFVSGGPLPNAV